ncbi:hypothetical protein B296_00040871 [Ensete ventricosum]|uniref:5-methyltetrahydropteroyltriglutamate--homocysteine S-methyltransferase n=1 Tax=Ensete ventricosum TaxID=4639 RepID=A0A426YGK5_ENSVE|nr:hypothetical protein B296_00040871 [Ensete ventricosum]
MVGSASLSFSILRSRAVICDRVISPPPRKMASHIVGYPRMGPKRELKFALESFWDKKSSADDLQKLGIETVPVLIGPVTYLLLSKSAKGVEKSFSPLTLLGDILPIYKISEEEYVKAIKEEINKVVKIQEELDIDVLVHGEPERNDMVEYFGEQLSGFAFTVNGWVQSYGSRCVKPPIIYGDVSRPKAMTVFWSKMAQSMTARPMKGMLTGPIALAIKKEVEDLEAAGIQIDEAALREGLPLRKSEQAFYLDWAVHSFRITNCGVQDTTQIHTHMCYSNFNDIIHSIIDMDADVITIENSRSDEKLLSVFREGVKYGAGIGPGVYDIHSPRIPSTEEIADRINKMLAVLETNILWVNPDCGLKTRKYAEVKPALTNMVSAAKILRTQLASAK